jgi:O-antigen/teichoic acid export membrane protein
LDIKTGIKTIFPIFVSLAGSGFVAFLTQVLLGQSLTVEEFGLLSMAMSIVVIMSGVIGFGMPSVWLLIFGQEGWGGFPLIRQSLKFLAIWGPLVLMISWVILLGLYDDSRLLETIGWLQEMVIMQVLVELLIAKLQLEARYGALSIWQLLPHLGRLVVAGTIYLSTTPTLDFVARGYGVVSMVLIVASGLGLLSLTPARMRLSGHLLENGHSRFRSNNNPSYKALINLAWPYAGSAALVMLYGRVDIVLLASLVSPTAAGQFTVAATFLLVVFLVPQAIYQKFLLPKIHRWYYGDWQRFLSVYRLGCAAMTILGIGCTVATYFWGASLVSLFFGDKYDQSGQILSILSVCIALRFVASSVESALMPGEYRKYRLYCQVMSTCIGLSSAYILIAQYGINGAILSRIITEFSLLLGYVYASSRYVLGRKIWSGWSLKLNQG